MNIELSIEREIDFMIKYELTADEFFLLKLIFYAQDGQEKYLKNFFTNSQLTLSIRELLLSLQNKGIINQSYKIPKEGTVFNPHDVDINKTVIKSLWQHSEDMGMELFNAYPSHITIKGRVFSLRNIAKSFKSFDDFCFEYGHAIKFDPKKHQEILNLLEYSKENNLISSGISDFVISRQWLSIQNMIDDGMGTVNTAELL